MRLSVLGRKSIHLSGVALFASGSIAPASSGEHFFGSNHHRASQLSQDGTSCPLSLSLLSVLSASVTNAFGRPTSSARNKSSSGCRRNTWAPATQTRRPGSGRPTSTATPRPALSATPRSSPTCLLPRTSPWPKCAPSSSARWSSPSGRRRRARTRWRRCMLHRAVVVAQHDEGLHFLRAEYGPRDNTPRATHQTTSRTVGQLLSHCARRAKIWCQGGRGYHVIYIPPVGQAKFVV